MHANRCFEACLRALRAAMLAMAGWIVTGTVLAADPSALIDIQNAQDNFFASHGESAPQEVDLLGVIESGRLDAQFALIDQVEGVGDHATIDQSGGPGNAAAVLEGFGDNNTASLTQNGAYNYIVLTQSGSSNRVDLLSQQGNYNSATVNQYNGSNALTLTQNYDYNSAQIDQYGGTSLNVTQNNAGGSSSSVNSLELKAYAEPGASPNFAPITLSGAGSTVLTVCNGGSAYCGQVQPK